MPRDLEIGLSTSAPGAHSTLAPAIYEHNAHVHAWRVELVKRMPLEHIYARMAHVVGTRLREAGL